MFLDLFFFPDIWVWFFFSWEISSHFTVCQRIYLYRCCCPRQDDALVSWQAGPCLPGELLCRRGPGVLLGSKQAWPAMSPGREGGHQHPGLCWQEQSYRSREVIIPLGSALIRLCPAWGLPEQERWTSWRELRGGHQGPGLSRRVD